MTVLAMGLPIDITREYGPDCRITTVALWPGTSIQSAATASLEAMASKRGAAGKYLRKPSIWSEAVYRILSDNGKEQLDGRALIDEDYLRERWSFTDHDFVQYRMDPNVEPKRAVRIPLLLIAISKIVSTLSKIRMSADNKQQYGERYL